MRTKSVDDIFLNISHFLDHFMMLIFAKAAYDAGTYFGLSYEEIIFFGTIGFICFGGFAPIASYLADKYSRSNLMVIFHFGIGSSALAAGMSDNIISLTLSLTAIGVFAAIYHRRQLRWKNSDRATGQIGEAAVDRSTEIFAGSVAC